MMRHRAALSAGAALLPGALCCAGQDPASAAARAGSSPVARLSAIATAKAWLQALQKRVLRCDVLHVPVPGALRDGLQVGVLGCPTEDSVCATGIRHQGGRVTGATRTVAHRHAVMGEDESLSLRCLHEAVDGGNNPSYREPLTGAQIERGALTALEEVP